MAELCLGTVQFGMKYGINNILGQPSWENSFEMLDLALEQNISTIDTARAYGEAEAILGAYIQQRKLYKKVKIISKLKPNCIAQGKKDVYGAIRRELENSLAQLHISQLDGYLLHTPEYIYDKQILKGLLKLKDEKLVQNIGVSIYDIEHGEEAIRTGLIDYIQFPYSIFDQRASKTEFIKRAKKSGITIYARSAFLQGLYFMKPTQIPKGLQEVRPYLAKFHNLLKKYNLGKIEALIHFVVQEPNIDYLVFGVDTTDQLIMDIDAYHNSNIPKEFIDEVKVQFSDMKNSIILPSLWSNGKKVDE